MSEVAESGHAVRVKGKRRRDSRQPKVPEVPRTEDRSEKNGAQRHEEGLLKPVPDAPSTGADPVKATQHDIPRKNGVA